MRLKTGQDTRSLPESFAALLALLAALLVSALALAPCAGARTHAHIYWITSGGEYGSDIGRANLNGTGMNRHLISGAGIYPVAIAVSGRHIYWADVTKDTIGRASLDGTHVNPDFLSFPESPAFRPHDIAVRGRYIYWASLSGYIGRAKINGTHAQLKFIAIKYFFLGSLAVNARHLYWTGLAEEEPNVIGRANLDGTGVKNSFFQSETNPYRLAVGGGHFYWTTPGFEIVRANLDGTGVRPKFITSDERYPGGIAVGGGHVYWTAWGHSSTNPAEDTQLGWIGRANLNGTGVHWIFVGSGEEAPSDIAVGPGT